MKHSKPGQTPTEYARANGVSLDWVYRLIRMGKLNHIRVYGRLFVLEPKAQKGPAR